ncbi:MAG: phospholipase [Chitinophagaceae bacterium]|nr:MAG: phospholipase [Chitinophagaceae bacterium]
MKWLLIICFILPGLFGNTQDLFVYENHFYNAPELNLPYRLLKPESFDTSKQYPLVIFLHGSNERGFDNKAQLNIGGHFFLRDSIRKNYPAFVLFPQCPTVDTWAYFAVEETSTSGQGDFKFPFRKKPTEVSAVLIRLIDSLQQVYKIDRQRIYIGGLSQGGMGVLDLIARYPDRFTAGFSICGADNSSTAKNFAGKVALWLFHGRNDDVIPVSFSQSYYQKLRKGKADVRYSEYSNVQHNSWVNAFAEPELMLWLFSRVKK